MLSFVELYPQKKNVVVLKLYTKQDDTRILKHHMRVRCYAKTSVLLSLTAAELKRNFAPFEINRKKHYFSVLCIGKGYSGVWGMFHKGNFINYQTLRLFQAASETVLDRSL